MRVERKTDTGNSVIRLFFVVLAIAAQVYFLYILIAWLNGYSTWIHIVTETIAVLLVLLIYGKHTTTSMKLPWIMLITAVPILGVILWFLMESRLATHPMKKRFEDIDRDLTAFLQQENGVQSSLKEQNSQAAGIANYLWRKGSFPLYRNDSCRYYADAAEALESQLADLSRAEKFIFMEYFAIEDKESFARIHAVLAQKVKEGVEVRLFYDDVGSISFINGGFRAKMEADGIRTRVFNPVLPSLRVFMNNRDHRKITVIDGKIAYTGGYNLANEYFNVTHPYGEWKDAGIRLTGPAVRTYTTIFLEMWNAIRATDKDDREFEGYFREHAEGSVDGFVQPYADSPLDEEQVGESVYMSIANGALNYLYFVTPYLILTDEMSRAITLAAERGVDVRIVTPGIPDKKITYQLTRSYYAQLVRKGVRIFEFTPGFCHAKCCVSDDFIATCGTINLDYRSLYHHFEDGCVMYGTQAVQDVKKDLDGLLERSCEVTDLYRDGQQSLPIRIFRCVLRLAAPLM